MKIKSIAKYVRENHKSMTVVEMRHVLEKDGWTTLQITGCMSKLRERGLPLEKFANNYPDKYRVDPQEQAKPKIGISIEEFRQKNDIFLIVECAAKKLERGVFVPEPEFVKEFFPGKTGYKTALEQESCKKYRGKSQGKWYWGHPDDIAEFKSKHMLTN